MGERVDSESATRIDRVGSGKWEIEINRRGAVDHRGDLVREGVELGGIDTAPCCAEVALERPDEVPSVLEVGKASQCTDPREPLGRRAIAFGPDQQVNAL